MISEQRQATLAKHLAQAGAAHGDYERTVLFGEYDKAWAEWYAHTLLGYGWNELFENAWTEEELAAGLRQADAEHRANAPGTPWYEYYAARFAERA